MALTATIYNFDIDLADSDRGVYETLALRVAQHPSESDDYLMTRVIAYVMEYADGIEFSAGGLSNPDEPALTVRDLTGALRSWIEVGTPDADRPLSGSPPWQSTPLQGEVSNEHLKQHPDCVMRRWLVAQR